MSHPLSRLLASGLEHHRAGRLQQAEAAYQAVIKEQPANADAWHLLGVLAHQLGKDDVAVELIEKAININPNEADFHNNCGEAYRAMGKYEAALACYEQALKVNPAFAGAHNNMGNIYKDQGQTTQAATCYRAAIEVEPGFFIAYNNLALVCRETGEHSQALAHFKQAIALMPDYAEAHNNLGNLLLESGQPQEAAHYYEKAIAIIPGYAEAHSNLGNALLKLDRPEQAIEHYQKALQIKPDFAMAHYNLGTALDELRRPEEAITHYEQAIALKPDYAQAHNNLGFALQEIGEVDKALSEYEKALSIQADYSAAHLHISMLRPAEAQIPLLKKLLQAGTLKDGEASHYHFSLGNIYNQMQHFDTAFEHYRQGNVYKRRSIDYKAEYFSRYVDTLIACYSEQYFQQRQHSPSDSKRPVFIVGLPRSGSTLIEQILSSHPEVHGAGELQALARVQRALNGRFTASGGYPECMPGCDPAMLTSYARQYLQDLGAQSGAALRVTDKDPGNFHRLGLLKTLFPHACIIHCQRDPLDTCLSIYFNYFAEGNEYAFDLQELGQYYLDYKRLMQHWQRLFGDEILPLSYEQLVDEQEQTSRLLVAHCGLAWDSNCLNFHLNKRAVRTASSAQVRQPLYRQSLQRWKHYEKQLAPLIEIIHADTDIN